MGLRRGPCCLCVFVDAYGCVCVWGQGVNFKPTVLQARRVIILLTVIKSWFVSVCVGTGNSCVCVHADNVLVRSWLSLLNKGRLERGTFCKVWSTSEKWAKQKPVKLAVLKERKIRSNFTKSGYSKMKMPFLRIVACVLNCFTMSQRKIWDRSHQWGKLDHSKRIIIRHLLSSLDFLCDLMAFDSCVFAFSPTYGHRLLEKKKNPNRLCFKIPADWRLGCFQSKKHCTAYVNVRCDNLECTIFSAL